MSRTDNPVLDRLSSIIETQTAELKAENASLKAKITKMLKEGAPPPQIDDVESVTTRMGRIFKLSGAVEQDGIFNEGSFSRNVGEEKVKIYLDKKQGNFQLYFRETKNTIFGFWYVSIVETSVNIEKEMADIRVLIEDCLSKDVECTFIIATNDDLSSQTGNIQ